MTKDAQFFRYLKVERRKGEKENKKEEKGAVQKSHEYIQRVGVHDDGINGGPVNRISFSHSHDLELVIP